MSMKTMTYWNYMDLRIRTTKLHTRDIKISRTPSHSFVRSKIWFQNTKEEVDTIIGKCFARQAIGRPVVQREPLKRANFLTYLENDSMQTFVVLFSLRLSVQIINEYSRYPVVEIFKSVLANATIPVLGKVIQL